MGQEHKNLQSTKQVKSELDVEEDKYFYPYIETLNTHDLFAKIIPFNIKIKGFSNLSRFFPNKSSRVNVYVMFLYEYDSNAVLSKTIQNRQAETISYDFLKIHNILKSRVSKPKVYIMYN